MSGIGTYTGNKLESTTSSVLRTPPSDPVCPGAPRKSPAAPRPLPAGPVVRKLSF